MMVVDRSMTTSGSPLPPFPHLESKNGKGEDGGNGNAGGVRHARTLALDDWAVGVGGIGAVGLVLTAAGDHGDGGSSLVLSTNKKKSSRKGQQL